MLLSHFFQSATNGGTRSSQCCDLAVFFWYLLDLVLSFWTWHLSSFTALVWHHRARKTGRNGAQRRRERKGGRNKLFLCLPWTCLVPGAWCLASRVSFFHSKPVPPSHQHFPRRSLWARLLGGSGTNYAGTREDWERGAGPRHRPDIAEIHHASQRAAAGQCIDEERIAPLCWNLQASCLRAFMFPSPLSPALSVTHPHRSFPGFTTPMWNVLPMWELRIRGQLSASVGSDRSLRSTYDGSIHEISIRIWV